GDRMPRPEMTTRRLDMWTPGRLCTPGLARRKRPRPRQRPRVLCSVRRDAPPGDSGLDVGLDVVDRLLHRSDLLGFFVRDLALELFFEGHHQFDGVEGIRTQVVDEGGAGADLVFLDAQLFDDDLLDALFDAAHWYLAPVEAVAVGSVRDSGGGGTGRFRPLPFRGVAAASVTACTCRR